LKEYLNISGNIIMKTRLYSDIILGWKQMGPDDIIINEIEKQSMF
jgi:hypothetical protein